MNQPKYRCHLDFQREAEQALKLAHNFHYILNTYTFIAWWVLFGVSVLIAGLIVWPYNWVFLAASLALTMVRVYKYFPATAVHLHNLPHMRRLADAAQQYYSRDGIVPSRMSWEEILLGIGREPRRMPRHIRDYAADWCFNHQELLMAYIDSLPQEVAELRRERRNARRQLQRQAERQTQRQFVSAPMKQSLLGAARSVWTPPTRVKVIRPVTVKRRPEPRPATRSLVPATAVRPAPEPKFQRLEDLARLLDLSDLLPPKVDHDHVQAIIVWGCINPGRRGKTMVQWQYITEQNVREKVMSKLGRHYDPEAFEDALVWLRQTRVVLSDHKRKRHQPVVALNPHCSSGVGVGREAIKRVLAAIEAIAHETAP